MTHPLDGTEVLVLLTLWRQRRRGDGRPLTVKAIHAALSKDGVDNPPSRSTIKKAVSRLIARTPFVLGQPVPREAGQVGPMPIGFSIRRDGIITWPTTARILLELYNYPTVGEIDTDRFVAHLECLRLTDEETDHLLTREDIARAIEECTKRGYILVDNAGHLVSSELVNSTRLFLEGIASRSQKNGIVNDATHPSSIK